MKDKFVVAPDSFTQEQWCEMYITVVNEYQNLKNNYNNILKKVDRAIGYINRLSNESNVFGHYGIDGNCKNYLLDILEKGDKND